MSGHWVRREKDIHKCAKPIDPSGVHAGDIWQCDECGYRWSVIRVAGDQQQRYIEWGFKDIAGIYAPGTK